MTPAPRSVPSTTSRRRAAAHRAAEGAVATYLLDLSRRPAPVRADAAAGGVARRTAMGRPAAHAGRVRP